MGEMNGYYIIVNVIDGIAMSERRVDKHDMEMIRAIADEYGIYVDDFADANDCGKCFTWEEVIGAFRCLWASGERV